MSRLQTCGIDGGVSTKEGKTVAPKRLVTIQDISCLGKCSLTVALPIISALGIECVAVPTAVLSTHTGGFTGFTFHDLTDELSAIKDHWKTLGITFDAFYTGYMGSVRQTEIAAEFMEQFSNDDSIIIVDPAMADNGTLYAGLPADLPQGMKNLCARADVIIPNITEAALMLGIEYRKEHDKAYIDSLVENLAGLGTKKIILTGVKYNPSELGAVCFDSATGERSYYGRNWIEGDFHGTGDVFASVCAGSLLNGLSMEDTVRRAVDFTVACIEKTLDCPQDRRYGVNFESCLPLLMR